MKPLSKLLITGLFCLSSGSYACDGNAHQFDFWLGNWQVLAGGKVVGTNRIEADLTHCVIKESYATPSGFKGLSVNSYDASRQVWHQTWIDNTGTLLLLEGKLVNGDMVLQGSGTDQQGNAVTHKISWTPNPDGSVRQHWQICLAEQGEWQTVFDGHYVPMH